MPPAIASTNTSPPAFRGALRRRLSELAALTLALAALGLMVALVTYDSHDPSLNTATGARVTNLAGPPGAIAADLLLQGFGLAGALPGLALLGWAWRIGSHRGLSAPPLRVTALLAATPVLAATLAAVTTLLGHALVWPAASGLGGAIGSALASLSLAMARDMIGPTGIWPMLGLGVLLSGLLAILAIGLSGREWRAAGRVARGGAAQARQASDAVTRGSQVMVGAAK